MQFGVLVLVHFCELDGRVIGGMQFGELLEERRRNIGEIDGRVLWGGAVGGVLEMLVRNHPPVSRCLAFCC